MPHLLIVITDAFARGGAALTCFDADLALATTGSSIHDHQCRGIFAEFRALKQLLDMLFFGVFAAHRQAVEHGLGANAEAFAAITDTLLHLGGADDLLCHWVLKKKDKGQSFYS